jgi:small conductance mechanosensitive channel
VLSLLQAWRIDVFSLFATDLGRTIVARSFSILVIGLVALLVWEAASAAIDRLLRATTSDGDGVLQSARARTLLPLARSALLITIAVTATLAGLSELGVNIAPLLAGAGVVGLAVGFGAQTLVKDIITGAFILFEDSISVGDVISVAGLSGTVEALSVRTIRLRDYHGTVHTIPFSAVDSVTNMTKDFAYFVAEVGVAYRESTDDVVAALREVGEALAADPKFADAILKPIDIAGVDRFDDSAVIIRVRIKVVAGQQWRIKREFNRRMKYKFDAAGIEIPFPHTTVFFGEDRDGQAPSAKLQIEGWPDRDR